MIITTRRPPSYFTLRRLMLLNFPATHHSILLACEEGGILFDSLFISVFFYSLETDMTRNVFLSRLNALQSILIINVHHSGEDSEGTQTRVKPVVVVMTLLDLLLTPSSNSLISFQFREIYLSRRGEVTGNS